MMEGSFNYSCDIWSIGMVTFEMATGNYPYRASSPLELKELIINSPSPSC